MDFPNHFIAATVKHTTFDRHVPAPYLRKSFKLDKPFDSAELVICGLGFYELFLNGSRLTKGALAPYISAPDDLVYFDRYDLAKYIKPGENVLGVILGNGMQNPYDGYIWNFEKAKWVSAPKLALRVEIKNGEETVAEINSDESFKTAPSPILFDGMRTGEFYDARREQPGWSQAGFDDSAWENAIAAATPRGEPVFCEAEPIVVTREIKPVSVTKQDDGYLYDFGENCAGICRLTVNGAAGQEISLEHGELLDENGKLVLKNIQFVPDGYVQRDKYVCKGDGVETHVPVFTYHGFQYVLVKGISAEQAKKDLLTYLVMNSDIPERGGFTCSDETANKLQEIIRRTTLANFYYFPTDCPQREKNGWTGDAAASTEHTLINLGAENSYKEWMRNIRKAQDGRGALPGIVPTGGWGFEWGNGPAWDRVIVNLPYYTYLYRGDTDILRDNAHAILRYLEYISRNFNNEGLIKLGLGDWCPPGRGADDYVSPLEFTDSVMCLDICYKASYIFDVLGLELHKAFADGLYAKLRRNIREKLIDFSTMTAAGNCQSSQAMAIYYNVFDEAEKTAAFRHLLEFIHRAGDKMDTGYLGARVIFHVLSARGESDLAFRMITTKEFPSYGYIVAQGCSSLWETICLNYTSFSLNHHFFGDISSWFIQSLAGIKLNPHRNNVDEINIRPSFVASLDSAKGFHIAPAGKIVSEWKRDGDSIELTVTVPEKMTGRILLEDGWVFEDGRKSIKPAKTGSYKIVKA